MRIQFTVTDEELKTLTKKAIEGSYPSVGEYCKCSSLQETPPALIGRWFYENVNNGLVKNVEHIGKAEGGIEKYKRI